MRELVQQIKITTFNVKFKNTKHFSIFLEIRQIRILYAQRLAGPSTSRMVFIRG